MQFENKLAAFHTMAGAYIAGKALSDYLDAMHGLIPLHNSGGVPIKGNKSLRAFTEETRVKTDKLLNMYEAYFIADPEFVKRTLEEVDRIEGIVSKVLMLSPEKQKRVEGLITQFSNEASEIEFLKEFEDAK